nr:putative ribonuclease H-like domain-containing protein [Tanacetum cinerariifolium]
MAKSSSSLKNEVFDDSLCSKSCKKNTYSLNTKITNLNKALSDSKTNLYHYKLALLQVEARLVEFKTQEIKFCEKIRGLEFDVKNKNTKIKRLTNDLELIKKDNEGLDSKLIGFESASKYLNTLLGSQRSDKNKEGLGYINVPPPDQVYSPSKKDMSWTGLLEFADDTITDYSGPSPSVETDSPTDIKTNKVENVRKSSDNGCSRHMTGNISYLSDYEPYNGGYVLFGQGGGKITSKVIIKTECIVLGRRIISWQCKKQTIMATSITKAEYAATASGCGQVLWIQN